MAKPLDLTDQVFGRLTALEITARRYKRCAVWKCRCSCGKVVFADVGHLRTGDKQSCGCLKQEGNNFKHGLMRKGQYHPLFAIWAGMQARCLNSRLPSFPYYGGRGIKICKSWRYFPNFVAWAEKNPRPPGTSLDRKNNNGNYTPRNCRWATPKEQANNRRARRR